jgi:cytochrome bd-type quinol oxidase subunit 2
MSSYDVVAVSENDIIAPDQFRQTMKLVRLQIAIPISVLIAMGANLICALAIQPGLSEFKSQTLDIYRLAGCLAKLSLRGAYHRHIPADSGINIDCPGGINALYPTLLSPNSLMIGLYWAVLYVLQGELYFQYSQSGFIWIAIRPEAPRSLPPYCWIEPLTAVGFCLTLLLVRKDETKNTIINGVGLRFAVANWLMAAWAVCFVRGVITFHFNCKRDSELICRHFNSSLVRRLYCSSTWSTCEC